MLRHAMLCCAMMCCAVLRLGVGRQGLGAGAYNSGARALMTPPLGYCPLKTPLQAELDAQHSHNAGSGAERVRMEAEMQSVQAHNDELKQVSQCWRIPMPACACVCIVRVDHMP
jgi:hypothetical protein